MNTSPKSIPIAQFELTGGALCLDLSNTWEYRERPETDRLVSYEALVEFAVQTECLDAESAADLRHRAGQDPDATARIFRRTLALREALYKIFSARANGREIAAADLEQLNKALARALGHQRLHHRGDEFGWSWSAAELEFPLWPVARSAADLLTSDKLGRLCECEADDCDWLFLDQSRSHSRRWCSMESCGNRAKARRHYQRCRKD